MRTTGASRAGYAGYRHELAFDETFCDVRYRELDTEKGRWTRRDPLGYVDGASLYAYAAAMPVAELDPYGLATTKTTGGGDGGFGGGYGGGVAPCITCSPDVDPDPLYWSAFHLSKRNSIMFYIRQCLARPTRLQMLECLQAITPEGEATKRLLQRMVQELRRQLDEPAKRWLREQTKECAELYIQYKALDAICQRCSGKTASCEDAAINFLCFKRLRDLRRKARTNGCPFLGDEGHRDAERNAANAARSCAMRAVALCTDFDIELEIRKLIEDWAERQVFR